MVRLHSIVVTVTKPIVRRPQAANCQSSKYCFEVCSVPLSHHDVVKTPRGKEQVRAVSEQVRTAVYS